LIASARVNWLSSWAFAKSACCREKEHSVQSISYYHVLHLLIYLHGTERPRTTYTRVSVESSMQWSNIRVEQTAHADFQLLHTTFVVQLAEN
jgi:hypothetical protein